MTGSVRLVLLLLLTYCSCSAALTIEDDEESSGDVAVPGKNPEIYSLHVTSNVTFRFATTHVISQLANREQVANELEFSVTLPKAAFITAFSMEIDGKIYAGDVKEKEAAKAQYEKAKKKGQSAGKVSAQKATRDTTVFKVSVNVAAESKIYFNLTYQELLQRRLGAYEHVINIDPGQVVRDLQVQVYLLESRDITFLKVPPLRTQATNEIGVAGTNDLAVIDWDGGSNALITYSPSVKEQMAASQDGVSGQFVVQYDVQRDLDAGEIQVVDGYFVHYFAPSGLDPVPKNVLFILDISGSMSGNKIEQTKEAMVTILTDLEPEDLFNIILFDDGIKFWDGQQTLMPATLENINLAKRFIRKMRAEGGTDINRAVVTGLEFLKNQESLQEDARASLIIFLTDGEPTSGVTNRESIVRNVLNANEGDVALFSLGFGTGVDFPFMKKMSLQNNGLARRIYADSDAALQLEDFYKEVSTPLLSNVQISYLGDAVDEDSLTESAFNNFFQGSELIVAGKLKDNEVSNILTQVVGESSTGDLTLGIDVDVSETEQALKESALANFTERLWAYLTIKKLLDKITETTDPVLKAAAKQQALDLSLKYSFVTPLTSMVVTKPERPTEDLSDSSDAPDSRDVHDRSIPPQRNPRPHSRHSVDNDPHFIVKMKGLKEEICFDVNGHAGDIFQLVYDWRTGIIINGQVVANDVTNNTYPDGGHVKTYFGQIAIMRRGTVVKITPSKILVGSDVYQWRDNNTIVTDNLKVKINRHKNVVVDMGMDVVFMVMRHKRKEPRPGKVDFLGFYIRTGKGLSHSVHGLLGQFQHRSVHVMHQDGPMIEDGKQLTRLRVRGADWAGERIVEARLARRRNMEIGAHVPCWFIRNSGHGLLDVKYSDYKLPKLTSTRFALSKYVHMGRKVSNLLLGMP